MGSRVNTIMQTCFFAISGILPRDEAIHQIKKAIQKTYGKRGEAVVQKNFAAVDQSLENLHEVKVPGKVTSTFTRRAPVPAEAPAFVRDVLGPMIAYEGDTVPVSAMPVDGTFPTGTTKWEKRNIALEIPVWESDLCIQCGKCVFVCPHAVIRHKVFDKKYLENAPATFKYMDSKFKEFPGMAYSVQVAPEDCTGCALCIEACPAKDKTNSQLLQPLFEFSGACSGCGETPYVKLMSQLFGDRAIIANATGCSSIYGGNLPTTPYTTNKEGRGPSWSNSLFEDNAEFGLGFRLTLDKQIEYARDILPTFVNDLGQDLIDSLLKADQTTDLGIKQQRERVDALKQKLAQSKIPQAKNLAAVADSLVKKSVWIVGGDGWAYDIGYGGLDHVISTGRNVNLLVLDTEVYSNTGGQASKSTPRGAVARFAAQGKGLSKKDLGLMAIAYGYVYVARVAMGFNDQHTLKSFIDAESFDGPSIIIAYSHCISHGIDMAKGLEQQKLAVQCGLWPLYRYDPRLAAEGKNPLMIDYKEPTIPVDKYMYNETRFRMLVQSDEARAEALLKLSREDAKARWNFYSQMAAMHYNENNEKL